MSDDRRGTQRRRDDDREVVLDSPVTFLDRKSGLAEVLEQRRQPRRRQDVKKRLVAQWKQTLALSSASARKLVTDPPPTPRPAPRQAPPKPPKPLRRPGRTVVNRVRRETVVETTSAVGATTPDPVVQAALQPHEPTSSRWIPTLPSLSKRIAEVAVQTAGTVVLVLAVKVGSALATLAAPPPPLPQCHQHTRPGASGGATCG